MWCWIRLLRVPWTARRSNQSILKEINSEYSLDGLMLKLKLQYFGLPMQRAYSLEKSLVLGKTEGKRRRGQQRIRWLDGIIDSVDMSWSKLWEVVKGSLVCCRPHGPHGGLFVFLSLSKSWTRLNDWTTTTNMKNSTKPKISMFLDL